MIISMMTTTSGDSLAYYHPSEASAEAVVTGGENNNNNNNISNIGDNNNYDRIRADHDANMDNDDDDDDDDLPAVANRLHALELHALSADDRNSIQEEMHGVRSLAVPETPELITESITQLLHHVDHHIAPPDKCAYMMGMTQSDPSRYYITRPSFLLQFLRAELFDPELAANRYCKWLQLLVEYFGHFALERDIYLTDLTREDHKFLRDGFFQLLPHRDRCGRRVRVMVGSVGKAYSVTTRMRVNMYLARIMAEDETTQRNGAVTIVWPSPDILGLLRDPEQSRANQRHLEATPLRYCAFHVCFPNSVTYRWLQALVLLTLGRDKRKVVRFHFGSHLECEYSLRTYGIPADSIPKTHSDVVMTTGTSSMDPLLIRGGGGRSPGPSSLYGGDDDERNSPTVDIHGSNNSTAHNTTTTTAASSSSRTVVDPSLNNIKTKNWLKWIRFQAAREEAKKENLPFPGVDCPGLDCILFRVLFRSAGVTCQDPPANVTFRQIIARCDAQRPNNRSDETASDKEAIVQNCIDEAITVHGLTFMGWDDTNNCYVPLDPDLDHTILRKQVLQALRNQRKRNKMRENRQQ